MSATNVTVNQSTPWTQYYCNNQTACPVAGTSCHYDKYCIPQLGPGETCLDAKDTVAPFVARIDNIYTLYCDMPNDIKVQTTKCPLGCESWEDCHGDICFLKKCTADQSACKAGNLDMCMGLKREEIICYESIPHGSTHPAVVEDEGLSSAQIGGIAGGVSVAVVALVAVAGFFLVRRRRAALAARAKAAEQALPSYSAQDEKNALRQVTASV
ncbi:hypothetical protein BGZ99_001446 [Dissophora globulifera]|uniref:Uncharacterized protein n=1 Tax=Dissophora globulifera TaxID=979702 RepID=A0A9P6UXU2_9FUNG|nr:hypothetical protein BGZ99_001446 [Dissophora globulifera]